MEKEDVFRLVIDMLNLSKVLPSVSLRQIYDELMDFEEEFDRVQIILRKHLASFDADDSNLVRDIQLIKSICPDYRIVHITRDLKECENNQHRVQIILKKYLENDDDATKRTTENVETPLLKRTLHTNDEDQRQKKFKGDSSHSKHIQKIMDFCKVDDDKQSTIVIDSEESNDTEEIQMLDGLSINYDSEPNANETVSGIPKDLYYSEEASCEEVVASSSHSDLSLIVNETLLDDIKVDNIKSLAANVSSSSDQQNIDTFLLQVKEKIEKIGQNIHSLDEKTTIQIKPDLIPNENMDSKSNQQNDPKFNWDMPSTSKNPVKCAKFVYPSPVSKQTDIELPSTSTKPLETITNEDTTKNSLKIVSTTSVQQQTDIELPSTSTEPLETTGDTKKQVDHPFYFKLMEIFPDICPKYLRKILNGKSTNPQLLDMLISNFVAGTFPKRKREPSPEVRCEFDLQLKILQDLFPDADPTYLQQNCERYIEQPVQLREFVAHMIETKDYPSKESYLKKMKLSTQEKQYTTEFEVEKFLEIIPNPTEHFSNNSKCKYINNFSETDYALTFLKNQYVYITVRDITQHFSKLGQSVVKTAEFLDSFPNKMKSKRKPYPITSCKNIPLLQECAYVKHKAEIISHQKLKCHQKLEAKQRAKDAGLLRTCGCCYDEEVMPEDVIYCENNHEFCRDCVRKGCEVLFGEGKLEFPCLETCDQQFSLHTLQLVLNPKLFSKLIQRKQVEEVKAAGIEDLEFCPFCDFATIPAPDDKLFRCLNNECMKESCRLCREPSHIPLRCDEVEKENDVKMRTYIEDKMTEALIRECYKCGLKFVKESGCNKMTCSCGAMMCYICKKPVKDYTHFNGQGGDRHHLCPLYSDTKKLHVDAVKVGAETAKKELGITQLKIDPTDNLEKHYRNDTNVNHVQNPANVNNLHVFFA